VCRLDWFLERESECCEELDAEEGKGRSESMMRGREVARVSTRTVSVRRSVSEYDKTLARVAIAKTDTSWSGAWVKSITEERMSAWRTPFTQALSHVSVWRAPKSSLRHRTSSSHCLIAPQTTDGTPATIA
jgi:hypothetical protein